MSRKLANTTLILVCELKPEMSKITRITRLILPGLMRKIPNRTLRATKTGPWSKHYTTGLIQAFNKKTVLSLNINFCIFIIRNKRKKGTEVFKRAML